MQRLIRFRLRTLMVVVTLVCVLAAIAPPIVSRLRIWYLVATSPVDVLGNTAFSDRRILTAVGLPRQGRVTPAQRNAWTESIMQLYRNNGYYNVMVSSERRNTNQGLTLCFVISEGRRCDVNYTTNFDPL